MWDLNACREALTAARTHSQLWKGMDYVRQVLGADAFSASRLHDERPERDIDHVQSIPAPALEAWYDDEAMRIDPVMQHLKQSAEPIFWDRETYAKSGQEPMWEALSRVGMSQGAGSVLHMSGGQHYVMGFDWSDTGDRDQRFRVEAMAATQLLIPYAEQASRRILADEAASRPVDVLSGRERECLQLVSIGKTAWEIAQILGISPHTANKHIDNCVRKLGVANRTHAATTAVRKGLL